jgi:hypothetical protein
MMQSAEDRAAKNTPCEQREITEAGQQAVGQVVLHIVRHVGTHDLDRDVSRAPSSWPLGACIGLQIASRPAAARRTRPCAGADRAPPLRAGRPYLGRAGRAVQPTWQEVLAVTDGVLGGKNLSEVIDHSLVDKPASVFSNRGKCL